MGTKEGDFLKRLLATFKAEAEEHLRAISAGLIELEKTPTSEDRTESIETVFREAHSLKGAARSVNLAEFERLCHSLENVFAAWKRGEMASTADLFDALHQSVDHLLGSLHATGAENSTRSFVRRIEELMGSATSAIEQRAQTVTAPPPETQPKAHALSVDVQPVSETVRVSASRLEALLRQTEELLSAKLAAAQQAAELRALSAGVSTERRDTVKRGVLESENLGALEHKLTTLAHAAEHDARVLGGLVDGLLQDMKQILMLPFASLLEAFPKLVRDLSREEGKAVELSVVGSEIEIDRRILEEIKIPLIHIVRNCIDHGIEKPEERSKKGKLEKGHITISIMHKNGNRVELVVADDGAGIDVSAVKRAAIKAGAATPESVEGMTLKEVQALTFYSGVTTSPLITDISGRGLGLAIVHEKVELLGGGIFLDSGPDIGTAFRIVLPVTLATFRGVLTRVCESLFVIPTLNVERVIRTTLDVVQTIESRETIRVDGAILSLVRLADVLDMPQRRNVKQPANAPLAMVLVSATTRIAFLVDEVLGEQEVLVKSLGKQLPRVRNVAGAAVLGSGDVAPILNVLDLLKSAVKASPAPIQTAASLDQAEEQKRILVAEDSITARTLLKNILETAGYSVQTVVDGAEAFTLLRTEEIDLVVSDVDMPRMNGFDLTAKIRADKKLGNMPVVLVTALESRDDKEHGVDVGANAYIVKSSFDQSNLLEVMRRLL